MRRLAAVLALCLCGSAQPQEQAAGVIEGVVLDSVSKLGIRRAVVTIGGTRPDAAPLELTTDGTGRFVVRGLAAGEYFVHARHAMYSTFLNTPERVSVTSEKSRHKVEIRLTPGGVIRGRVLDEDRLPAAEVRVTSMRVSGSGLGRRLQLAQTAQTDAAGAYRIEGLMPGRYVVAVQTPSAPFQPLPLQPVKRARPPRSLGYAPMFYPESPGAGTAEAILVAAGSERAEVDFRLKVTPVLRVPVVVTGARAGELVLVRLTPLDRWNGPNFESAQGADSGAATLENVPPGTYRLTAETAGDPSACRVASVPLVVSDRPLPRVELRLEGGPSVTIQIRDAEGRPAKAQFRLEPLGDEAMTLPVFDEQAQPPAMKCLTAGVWAVRLFDRMQVVKAVQVGPETVRGDVFRVEAALPPSLVFVVGPASARIVARVDGTTDRALIVALRETAQGLAPPVVWLSGDPPPPLGAGRYRLAAVPSTIPANEWLLELLEGFLETVELQDGEEKQATLKFLSMDQIHKALER